MEWVFSEDYAGEEGDAGLVAEALRGEKRALECLVRKHWDWVYNISARMVGDPEDALDVTQEIMVKAITKLSTFEGRSGFRTWLYRIAANHVLSLRRKPWERVFSSFEKHDRFRERLEDPDFREERLPSPEERWLIEEAKAGCMAGMLLCLDRAQRLAFILGGVFGIDSRLGGAIMEESPENFRQILARARKQLRNYMEGKCGLMDRANPCRCERKTRLAVKAGIVDPGRFTFYGRPVKRVRDFVSENASMMEGAAAGGVDWIFRDQCVYQASRFEGVVAALLRRAGGREG